MNPFTSFISFPFASTRLPLAEVRISMGERGFHGNAAPDGSVMTPLRPSEGERERFVGVGRRTGLLRRLDECG